MTPYDAAQKIQLSKLERGHRRRGVDMYMFLRAAFNCFIRVQSKDLETCLHSGSIYIFLWTNQPILILKLKPSRGTFITVPCFSWVMSKMQGIAQNILELYIKISLTSKTQKSHKKFTTLLCKLRF